MKHFKRAVHIFTALHGMQAVYSYEKDVRLSKVWIVTK